MKTFIFSPTFTVAVIAHCPRGAVCNVLNSCNTIPRFPLDSHLSTTFPLGSCVWQKEWQSKFPPPNNTRYRNLFSSSGFVRWPDTYLHPDIHSAFVRTVIQLQWHRSDFDGVTWPVSWPVGLDEGGDVPGAEVEGGGVCEKQAVSPVAPHSQVEEGTLGFWSKDLGCKNLQGDCRLIK